MTREQMIDAAVRKACPEHAKVIAATSAIRRCLDNINAMDGVKYALVSAMFSNPECDAIRAEYRRLAAKQG